ncbi:MULTISPECIES: hypothetical protein [Nostoc]|uniref:Uncharacterized protein n=1 Tax=Nostoc paludosum FACHB-159 TaxID=2692908 RepID=A0ABR8KG48_9NOSO|nr:MULTISPECIES: hypothetical protein [Nostoc]MBD2681564.1 hypothetical protein [Nostoc sp. FACHB-857]MBD2738025.1 hypothetical protein [Nostoc paludosum FACHB-159]
MESFNKFLKLVPKLPIILQIVLLPVLVLLWLVPTLIVVISFIVLFCGRHRIKTFMEQFVEHKDQEINRVISKIEMMDDAIKFTLQSGNQCNYGDRDNLLQAQHELEDAIKILQTSRKNFQNANAEFNEAIKDFCSKPKKFKHRPKLPAWIVKKLPEDWRSDLEELQHDWIDSECSRLVFQLRTTQRLLEMGWAKLMIRWSDYRDGNTTKQVGDQRTTN